jgi:hypothetical protein
VVWKDLLAVLPGTAAETAESAAGRVSAKLDELLAAVEAVAVSEEAQARQALLRLEWRASAFSLAPLDAFVRVVPRAFQERAEALRERVQATLEQLVTLARGGPSELAAVRPALLSLRRDLDSLAGRIQKEARRARSLRATVLLVPSLLGAMSAAYLRSDRGLRLVRIEASAPAAAYAAVESSDGVLAPRPEYLDEFMREFSKFYFGHPSQFESIYYDREKDSRIDRDGKPDKDSKQDKDGTRDKEGRADRDSRSDAEGKPVRRRTVQHKLSLRNASHGEVSYLSSVEAVVEATGPAAFPWSRLTVTPQVAVQQEEPARHRSLLVKSDGIGPALELSFSLTAKSGLEVVRATLPLLHRGTAPLLAATAPGIAAQPLQDGAISPPLYLRLARPPAGPAPHVLEVKADSGSGECEPRPADYGFYEEISTVERLRQLTAAVHAEPWTLELRYASLKGEPAVVRLDGVFDGSEVFYRSLPTLLAYDPRCARGAERGGGGVGAMPDLLDSPLGDLAMLFVHERATAQPRGIDLLSARLGLDLFKVPAGSRVAAADPLDGFLNPQGVLSVYLTMNMPASLRYAVTLRVNGQPAARYSFDGLVPEFLTFESEGPARAIARLRKVFGAAPKPGSQEKSHAPLPSPP